MQEKTIRFGIVGAGGIAPSHAFAIDHTDGATLAAVCDIRREAAVALAGRYSVPYFADLDEMLDSNLVDAVGICTPSGLHLDAALKAVQAGKHVLVEKPIEITPERIDLITGEGRRRNVKVGCVLQCRFSSLSRELKQRIDAGMLGDIYYGTAHSRWLRTQEYYDSAAWRGTWSIDGGGCLMNQGIHITDVFLWMMGEAEAVIGIAETRGRQVEVETLALAMIDFAGGVKGVIEATTLAYPGVAPYIEIIGSKGTVTFTPEKLLSLDLVDCTADDDSWRESVLERQAQEESEQAQAAELAAASNAITSDDMGHTPVYTDFVEAVMNDREPYVNGEEARKAVAVITAIYRSARDNSTRVQLTE